MAKQTIRRFLAVLLAAVLVGGGAIGAFAAPIRKLEQWQFPKGINELWQNSSADTAASPALFSQSQIEAPVLQSIYGGMTVEEFKVAVLSSTYASMSPAEAQKAAEQYVTGEFTLEAASSFLEESDLKVSKSEWQNQGQSEYESLTANPSYKNVIDFLYKYFKADRAEALIVLADFWVVFFLTWGMINEKYNVLTDPQWARIQKIVDFTEDYSPLDAFSSSENREKMRNLTAEFYQLAKEVNPSYFETIEGTHLENPDEGVPGTSKEYIKAFGKETRYEATFLNYFLFYVCFGWIWMNF
jgi:hypothetical protein